jgi:hypothetical protein
MLGAKHNKVKLLLIFLVAFYLPTASLFHSNFIASHRRELGVYIFLRQKKKSFKGAASRSFALSHLPHTPARAFHCQPPLEKKREWLCSPLEGSALWYSLCWISIKVGVTDIWSERCKSWRESSKASLLIPLGSFYILDCLLLLLFVRAYIYCSPTHAADRETSRHFITDFLTQKVCGRLCVRHGDLCCGVVRHKINSLRSALMRKQANTNPFSPERH